MAAFIQILALCALAVISWAEIRVVINEIDLKSPSHPGEKEFIELRGFQDETSTGQLLWNPMKSKSLQGFFVIGIQVDKKSKIDLVVNLWNSKTDENGYAVIGGNNVQNSLNLQGMIRYREMAHVSGGLGSAFGRQTDKSVPYAIALLRESLESRAARQLTLSIWEPFTEARPYIILEKDLVAKLKPYIVDMVVIGRQTMLPHCKIYQDLHDSFSGTANYLVREMQGTNPSGFSVNRCTVLTAGFLPEYFKLGTPTPGADNDCAGARFIIEDAVSQASQTPQRSQSPFGFGPLQSPVRLPESECVASTSGMQASGMSGARYEDTASLNRFAQSQVDSARQSTICLSDSGGITGLEGDLDHTLIQDLEVIGNLGGQAAVLEWDTEANFDPQWEEFMRLHFQFILPIAMILQNKKWFELLPDDDEPRNTKFRCRLCSKYVHEAGVRVQHQPLVSNPAGVSVDPDIETNSDRIRDHASSAGHTKVIAWLKQRELDQIRKRLADAQKRTEEANQGTMQVTARMVRAVYAEAKMNIPFISHNTLVQVLKLNGADMGMHHANDHAASDMTELIGSTMHAETITHLMDTKTPLSIIVDGSTDLHSQKYLIVYFQAMELNEPKVYFYKLIPVDYEDADSMLTALLDCFEQDSDDFKKYIKDNLVGFASDGASSMTGRENGLKVKLNTWTGRSLYAVHCMAHRLELALKWSIRHREESRMSQLTAAEQLQRKQSVAFYEDLQRVVGGVVHYYRDGPKKHAHLRNLAAVFRQRLYELQLFYRGARWVAADYNT